MGYKFNPFTGNFDITDSPDGVFDSVEVNGDINLDDGGASTTTVQCVTPTQDRTISFPDATGTVALVAGSSGQLTYNNAGAQAGLTSANIGSTGQINVSLAGAASTPPVTFTGSWFTGGTATTTKPQLLIEPTGTTSTAWSTSGTGLGVNAASGFAGNLLDLQVNGTSKASISSSGVLSASSIAQSAFNVVNPLGSTGISAPSFPSGNFVDFHGVRRSTAGVGFIGGFILFGGSGNYDLNVILQHEGANIFAQRNGTNAQTFRVYNTYTSGTNYELGKLEWGSNVFRIGTEKGSAGGTARALEFQTDGTPRATVETNGYLRLSANCPGIQFNGDTAPANALDDYEEGTWTPVMEGTSSAGTGTYTQQIGSYTKIGNRVMFNCRVGWSAHTGTGDMFISGLPFSVGQFSSFAARVSGITVSAGKFYIDQSTNKLVIEEAVATSADFIIGGQYRI